MSIQQSTIEPTIISRLYTLTLLIHKTLREFPKPERYSLGERIETALMNCITSACLTSEEQKEFKTRHVLPALAHAELAKILIRMAQELDLITLARYQHIGNELIEISSMLGGWLRYARTH